MLRQKDNEHFCVPNSVINALIFTVVFSTVYIVCMVASLSFVVCVEAVPLCSVLRPLRKPCTSVDEEYGQFFVPEPRLC